MANPLTRRCSQPPGVRLSPRVADLGGARKARPHRLRQFYCGHHCRSEELIQQRLQLLAQAQPLTADAAVVLAQSVQAQSVARELTACQPFWPSIIGALRTCLLKRPTGPSGTVFPAAAWGTQRNRFPTPQAMSCYRGIAPVEEASGNSVWIHRGRACPKSVRQSFHEMAQASLRSCVWAQGYYQQQIRRGNGRHAAIRG